MNKYNELENVIYSKLEEKVSHDKTARYLNKLLLDSKESTQEQELSLVETENLYGKKLLELEQLNLTVPQEKLEFEGLLKNNAATSKEIDEIQKEIKRHETAIERKQVKIITLSKTIEEVIYDTMEILIKWQNNIKALLIPPLYRCYHIQVVRRLVLSI